MARETQVEGDDCSASVIKLLCSYGGKIVPRKSDGKLCYVGGFTRILSVDRSTSYSELMVKLVEFCGFSVVFRCQLPSGDLETLITIKSDEDLANLVEEYDKVSVPSPQKIRAVLFPPGSLKVVSTPSSSASSVDSSGNYSPMRIASNRGCFRSRSPSPPVGLNPRVEKLRCYPCYVEPRVWNNRRRCNCRWMMPNCLDENLGPLASSVEASHTHNIR